MTIKEIIELQDSTEHLYLLRQGLFYRGYNQAAAFLSDAFGYRLLSKEVKSCGKRLFYVGFPAIAKDKVIESVSKGGGLMEQNGDDVLVISGITVSYDESVLLSMVKTPRVRPSKKDCIESEGNRITANPVFARSVMTKQSRVHISNVDNLTLDCFPLRKTRARNDGKRIKLLAAEIAGFNLTGSTPVECMNFIARLQERLNSPAL